MTAPRFELSVDQRMLVGLRAAMRAEEDGAQLKKELIASFKVALQPGIDQAKSKLSAIPHHGSAIPTPGLGAYLAPRVKASVRLSGRSVGVSVRMPQTPGLRKFGKAARWLNRGKWRHKVFGREVWVEQQSPIPGFFDDAFREDREKYRLACIESVHWMFRRIAERKL